MDIRKANGIIEQFSTEKLHTYLQKGGVPETSIEQLLTDIEEVVATQSVESTLELRGVVAQMLEQLDGGVKLRARYLLKESIYALGPAGFNFEVFVAKLLEHQGFETQVGIMMDGKCVEHEVDIFATRGEEKYLVECKFHNKEGIRSDLTTSLYVNSRFDDLKAVDPESSPNTTGWLATNTKLTDTALKFASCHNIQVLSLSKPNGKSITDLVFKDNLFPVTSLKTLENYHEQLLDQGKVLIQDIQVDLNAGKLQYLPETILDEVRTEIEGIVG